MIRLLLACLLPLAALAQPPDTLWSRAYGGDPKEDFRDLVATADGGWLLVGTVAAVPTATWHDVKLTRIDSAGNLQWMRGYGRADVGEQGGVVTATTDGGFLVAGNQYNGSGQGVFLLRTDAEGDSVWTRIISSADLDDVEGICARQDGGFALAGASTTFSSAGTDAVLLLVDSAGTVEQRCHYGEEGRYEGAFSVRVTQDGGFLLAGRAFPVSAFQPTFLVIRTDGAGLLLWKREYVFGDVSIAIDAVETADGTLVAAGTVVTDIDHVSAGLLKMTAAGDTLWSRRYFNAEDYTYVEALVPLVDGGFVMAGQRETPEPPRDSGDVALMRVDADGNLLWSARYHHPWVDLAYSVGVGVDGGYLLAGLCENWSTLAYGYMVKTAPDPVFARVPHVAIPEAFGLLTCYPNPFNSATEIRYALPHSSHVSLKVFDVTGREVAVLVDRVVSAGEQRVAWNASAAASGVYFVRLTSGERALTRKVLLVR